MLSSLRPLPLVALGLFLVSCDQPPSKEIAAAEASLSRAREEGADRYAPVGYQEAEKALEAARQKINEKDYRGALSSATEAADKARSASQQAGVAKTVARGNAETARAEVQALLDEIQAIQDEAANDKVPEQAFEYVTPVAEEVRGGLQRVSTALDSGDWLSAQRAASDVKGLATPLPGRFREALDSWKTAHPTKAKTPAAVKPPVKK
jgi:hypothetical protein